jgi:hypothetical protein
VVDGGEFGGEMLSVTGLAAQKGELIGGLFGFVLLLYDGVLMP